MIRTRTALSAIGAFCCSVLFACRGDRQANSADARPADDTPGRLYYGATSSGQGWTVYLDFLHGEGVLYSPVESDNVCDLRLDASGAVSWSSPPSYGFVSSFEGALVPTGLRGTVTWTEVATGRVTRSFQVNLDSMRLPSPSADTITDRYVDVNYIEQAGDLTGLDLLILRRGKDTLALLTMYEGTPSGPWVMKNLRWVGDTLRGSFGSPTVFDISLVRQGDALVLDSWGKSFKKTRVGLRALLFGKRSSLAPCGDRKAESAPSSDVKADTKPHWYVGMKEGNAVDGTSDFVWFLRFDHRGPEAFYDRSAWVRVCDWWQSRDGFSFQTAERSGRVYKASGRVFSDTLRGGVEIESRSSPQKFGWVTFRPVDRPEVTQQALGSPGGVYSTMTYVADAGDVAGDELFTTTAGGEPRIVLTVDAVGPYIARDVRRSGDTLHFHIGDAARDETSWRVVLRDTVAALWYGAAAPRPDGGPTMVLPRSESLTEFFGQEALGNCSNN